MALIHNEDRRAVRSKSTTRAPSAAEKARVAKQRALEALQQRLQEVRQQRAAAERAAQLARAALTQARTPTQRRTATKALQESSQAEAQARKREVVLQADYNKTTGARAVAMREAVGRGDGVGGRTVSPGAALSRTVVRDDGLLAGAHPVSSKPGADSVRARVLRDDTPRLLPIDLPVTPMRQDRNACGPTVLAMLSNYFGNPVTPQSIDREIRRFGIGTSPDNMVGWARENGFRADIKNEASLEDIATMIDQGVPPIALIEPSSPRDLQLHYYVVTGYERGPGGEITTVAVSDPVGERRTMPADQFMREWSRVRLGGIRTGADRMMITMVPEGGKITTPTGDVLPAKSIELPRSTLGANLRLASFQNSSDGLGDFLNGIRNFKPGDVVAGGVQLVTGLAGTLVASVPVLRELFGAANKVVDFATTPLRVTGNVVGKGLKAAGRGLRAVGRAVGRFFGGLF